MTKKNFKELGVYVRAIADEMGLRDWHLFMRDEEPDSPTKFNGTTFSAIASCEPTPGQRYAVFRFSDRFDSVPLEEVRMVVVHELTHCILADTHELLRTGILNQLSQSTYDIFMESYDLAQEHAIDHIARAWAEKMPKITWPEPQTIESAELMIAV